MTAYTSVKYMLMTAYTSVKYKCILKEEYNMNTSYAVSCTSVYQHEQNYSTCPLHSISLASSYLPCSLKMSSHCLIM